MQIVLIVMVSVLVVALCGAVFLLLRGGNIRGRRDDVTEQRIRQMQQEMLQMTQNTAQNVNAQFGVLTETLDRRLSENTTQLNTRIGSAADSIAKVQKTINTQLSDNTKRIDHRLDTAAQSFTQVKELLAKVESSNKQIYEVTKDVASLQDILTAPKLRGGFGELMLGDLLASMLPDEFYTLQHRFKSGDIVDAVITLRDNTLISVDSKFPLENFKRTLSSDATNDERRVARRAFVSDVKKHVQAIAKKYIVPDEGTMDFALMYIPAENVYYETIVSDKEGHALLEYFFKHRVIPVSPNSFYAYLMTIMFGLRGLRIEKQARDMITVLDRLAREHDRFSEEFDVLGKHLGNAQKKYDDSSRRLGRIDTHVEKIRGAQTVLSQSDADNEDKEL